MKLLIRKLENSWIFWAIFVVGVIAVFSTILGGNPGAIPAGYLLFPLGILFLIPGALSIIEGFSAFNIIFDIIYYGVLGLIVTNIVRDKRFNTKLILLLLAILILTFIGCVQMKGSY